MNFTRDANAFLLSGGLQARHQRAQLGARCPQLFLCLLALGDIFDHADPKLPTAVSVADGRSSQMSPQHPPVFPDKAFFDLVIVALTLKHLSGEGSILSGIIGVRELDKGHARNSCM